MATGTKILVVDDEAIIFCLLTSFLGGSGFEVFIASGGRQALAFLETHPEIDVVLSDVQMPGMNGWEFWMELHKIQSPLIRRFIFMSGAISDDSLLRSVQYSGCRFLQKPFLNLAKVAQECTLASMSVSRSWEAITT